MMHHEHHRQEAKAEESCDRERAPVEPEFFKHRHSSTFVTRPAKRARFTSKPKAKSPLPLIVGVTNRLAQPRWQSTDLLVESVPEHDQVLVTL